MAPEPAPLIQRSRFLVAVLLGLGATPAPVTAQAIPAAPAPSTASSPDLDAAEWIAPTDPLATDVRDLALLGYLPIRFGTEHPSSRIDVARAITASGWRFDAAGFHPSWLRATRALAGELERLGHRPLYPESAPWQEIRGERGTLRLRPYADLSGRWSDGGETDWRDGARVGLAGTAHFGRRLSMHQDISVGYVAGGRAFADALIAHTDLLVALESAYVGFDHPGIAARIGRVRHDWGPSRRGNLLLDRSAAPFDHLEIVLPFGPLRLSAISGVLSWPEERNLAAHRLAWTPHRSLMVGFSEGVIFPGPPLQPLYLLGFVPYTLVERIQGQDAGASLVPRVRNNVLWVLDLAWRPRPARWIWGAVLLDDIATESAEAPDRFGLQLGTDVALGGGGRWMVGASATKVTDYAYSVYSGGNCECDWAHQGRALGFPEGPDVEEARLDVRWVRSVTWTLEGEARIRRHGEGRLGEPFVPSIGVESSTSRRSAWRLRGVVETRREISGSVRWTPRDELELRVTADLSETSNPGHRSGARVREGGIELRLRAHR